ncbi:hypothetical protein Pfo_008923 [Paulownia fortunei]|nr:hypothetical protein Pfo_008923 [Paulownia fortunei]
MIDSKAKRERKSTQNKVLQWQYKDSSFVLWGMGTKIQANAFLREYHSVIDLDGSTSNGMRSVYHENQIVKNGENRDSFTLQICKNGYLGYDPEKVRQTILEHESIFRNQLQELHRLYGRQQELMNEIKKRIINKDDVKEEKSQSSSLFSPIPPEDAKRTWNACHSSSLYSMTGCLSTSGTSGKLFPSFLEDKNVPIPPTQDTRHLRSCEPRLSKSSIFPKRTYDLGIPADVYSNNTEKQMQERFPKLPGVESTSGNRNHQASYDRDTKLSLSALQTSQRNADALTFNLCFKRTNHQGDLSITNPTDGIPDSLTLSRGEVSANSCSNFNLVTKDFFQNSLDGMNGGSSLSIQGLRNERTEKEHLSDDYADKRRFDKHSSVGDFCSGKSLALPQSQLAEPRKEFLNCPLDMGVSVSRRKKKIFGVEIPEGNDVPFDAATNLSSTLDLKVGPHQENDHVVSFKSSSWIANSFVQNLELGGRNVNDGKNERSKADLKGELSSQKRFSYHPDMNGKWLQGCSSIGLNFVKVPYQYTESDPKKCFKNLDDMNSKPAEVLKKDSEHSLKFQQMVPQHHVVLADCQSNQENPKGGLPWFLRNSHVSGDLSKWKKSSYFMNLDSLQNCTQKFFRKAEIADGTFQTLKQKKEISAPMIAQDAEDSWFSISDMLQSFKDLNSGDNLSKVNCYGIGGDSARKVEMDEDVPRNQLETKDLVLHKGLNNYIADMRHHIDLNLSLHEDDAPSAPSLPTAIVKIATTEIDLEAPAVIEFETDASPKEVNSRKMDVSPGKSEVSYEECDKIAADAIIAISMSAKKNLADDSACEPAEAASSNCLKWFAEIISSQCGDTASIHVEVSLDRSGACNEEESIPDGMDYFEFMTLKLEDTKKEHYHYEPVVLNNPSDDETGATLSKRPRRGQSRRGRQRKDFQRDTLPGLVTLSRLEVTEDLQAFEELLKAEGSTWQLGLSQRSSMRNGRGRKRSGGPTTSPKVKALCSAPAQQPICQLEERSLTGWGKRTRRLPRQRCPNAFLSFPVKC